MGLLDELLSGNALLIAGLLLIATAFVLRRRGAQRRQTAADPLAEIRLNVARSEQSLPGRIHQAEVRLHDFAREVEGRLQTRMHVLDQMIVAADREILRMQGELSRMGMADANGPTATRSPDVLPLRHTTPGSDAPDVIDPVGVKRAIGASALGQAILALAAQGMSPEVIAEATAQPVARVLALIEMARSLERRDAA